MAVVYVCPEHGRVFVHPGATLMDPPDVEKVEPLREDVQRPQPSEEATCPVPVGEGRCRRTWDFVYEADG